MMEEGMTRLFATLVCIAQGKLAALKSLPFGVISTDEKPMSTGILRWMWALL